MYGSVGAPGEQSLGATRPFSLPLATCAALPAAQPLRLGADRFDHVDQRIYGHLTLRILAALAQERGGPRRSPAPLGSRPRGMSG